MRTPAYKTKQEPQNRKGYVYLFKVKNKGYKIGSTAYLENRLKMYKEHLNNLFYFKSNECLKLERYIQNKFWHKRLSKHSEWFRLDKNDVDLIKTSML